MKITETILNNARNKQLLLFDDTDEPLFNKSNLSYVAAKNTENVIKMAELEKCIPGQTILYKYKDGYRIEHKWTGVNGVAICCGAASDTPDGLPRFCMELDTIIKNSDEEERSFECAWSTSGYYVNELGNQDWGVAENDMNGYLNTLAMDALEQCEAARKCQAMGSEYYLPSIGELKLATKYSMLDNYLYQSSNQRDETYNYTWSNEYEDIYLADKRDDNNEYVCPFIRVTPDNLYVISSNNVNESKLLSFDVSSDIEFNKSLNTLDRSNKKALDLMFDFQNCKFGDKVYYNDLLGYNLLEGDYAGLCCIEAGQLDDKPRFAYKEDLGRMNWDEAMKKCKEIPNGYLPIKNELKLAFDYCLSLSANHYYWSSTLYGSDRAFSIRTEDGDFFSCNKDYSYCYVRPFIHINQLKNNISESVDTNLLSMKDSEIEFNKSSQSDKVKHTLNKAKVYLKLLNCKLYDLVYHSPSGNGKFVIYDHTGAIPRMSAFAECCVEAGQLDDYPRFVSCKYAKVNGPNYTADRIAISSELNVELYKELPLYEYQYNFFDDDKWHNFYNDGDWKFDINGYDNTLILLSYDSPLANKIYDEQQYYYIPAAGELYLADKNGFKYRSITSTLNSESMMIRYDGISDNHSVVSCLRKSGTSKWIPFVHIDENNLEI